MLVLQDWLLFSGHVALVLFNLVGWIWRRTRVAHLVAMGLTTFSWFVLGAVYGWGYCFCTDYHAHVLRQLGHPGADVTFIQLMFQRLLGLSVSQPVADKLTVAVFLLIWLVTCVVWVREWTRFRLHMRQKSA